MFSSLVVPAIASGQQFNSALGAAFNDPLSNVVFLGQQSRLSRTETLQKFIEGGYPEESLAAFFLYFTHHRCFDSPVGYALLAIESFSRLAWFETIKCRKEGNSDIEACKSNPICFNRALMRVLYQMLTPLAEGLALYGELNAYPGRSKAASQIAINATSVYFERQTKLLMQFAPFSSLYDEFGKWLNAEREKDDSPFAATTALLNDEPEEPWKEPYLIGYAWVNQLIAELHRHSSSARQDTDVSLAFLCSFFFDDWHFASIIARAAWGTLSHIEPTQTIQQITNYLESRIQLIHQPDVDIMFEEYTEALVAGSLNSCSFTNYKPELQQLLQIAGASSGGSELYIHAPKASQYRHIFRFGVMTADEMSLNLNDGICQCDIEGHTYSLPILKGGAPAFRDNGSLVANGYDATIEFVLLKWVPYVCFFFRGNLIAVTDRRLKPIAESEAEVLFGNMSSFYHNEWWRRHYWDLLDPSSNTTCGTHIAQRLQEAETPIRAIYQI